jgi:hypothetical protein
MFNIARKFLAGLALCALTAATGGAAQAAGAIAIGHCDRYGYSHNAASSEGAAARALAECRANGARGCEVVVRLHQACGAFAVSGRGGCGARGWAYAGSRGAAEEIALAQCRKYGGANCYIQAWVCDGGP